MNKPFCSSKTAGVLVGAVATAKLIQSRSQRREKKRKADEDVNDKDLIREPKRRRQSRKRTMSKAELLVLEDLDIEPLIPNPTRSPQVRVKTPSPQPKQLSYSPTSTHKTASMPLIPVMPPPPTKERFRQTTPDQNPLQIDTRKAQRSTKYKPTNRLDEAHLEARVVYRPPEKPMRAPPRTVTFEQIEEHEKSLVRTDKKQVAMPIIFDRPSGHSHFTSILIGVIIALLLVVALSIFNSSNHPQAHQSSHQKSSFPHWPVAEASEYIWDDMMFDDIVADNRTQNALCVIEAHNDPDIVDILLRLKHNFNEFKQLHIKASSYLRKGQMRRARNH